jgi:DnaJ-class molecular chaperone
MASYTLEQMSNPEAHGLMECPHCNGYGSSLKDPDGVDRCTMCGGAGLLPKHKEN